MGCSERARVPPKLLKFCHPSDTRILCSAGIPSAGRQNFKSFGALLPGTCGTMGPSILTACIFLSAAVETNKDAMWELVHMTNAHPINKSTSPHQRMVELGRVIDELLPTAASRLPVPNEDELEALRKPLEAWKDMEERGKLSIIRAFRLSPLLALTLRRVSLLCTTPSSVLRLKLHPHDATGVSIPGLPATPRELQRTGRSQREGHG